MASSRSKSLTVKIVGDADQLNKSLGVAGRDLDKFGKKTDTMGKKFGASMKLAGAAAATGLAVGLKQSVSAAVEAEKSQARLEAQLKASGTSYDKHAAAIEKSIAATAKLSGLDDEDLADSFTNIVRVTGDVNEALKLNALAADIARAKNLDVAKAGEIVAKVAGGNTGILKRYGVTVKEGATVQEALAEAQKKFGGQAEAYGKTTAGAMSRANVAFESVQETVGAALAPALETVANKLADLSNWAAENPGKFKTIAAAIGITGTAIGGLLVAAKVAGAVSTLRRATLGLNLAMTANPAVLIAAGVATLGVALYAAYQKSATFRKGVDAAFGVLKSVGGAALKIVIGGLDKLLGLWSTMLGALGHVPKFGWAKKAADSIDKAREKLRGLASGLNDLPTIKNLEVRVNARISPNLRRLLDEEDSIGSRPPVPGLRRASGGVVPGSGRGDKVPAMLEPGEYVIQRKVVEQFGPTYFAAINEGRAPQRFTSGGIVARANKLDGMRIPYVYGGGHGTRDGFNRSGMDCSASVSYALGISPRVSGALMGFGKPGAGSPNDTKIYANPQHVFAVFNGRGWGTSKENPGGGPGWLSYNHRSGFTIRHLEDGGAKTAAAKRGNAQERSESGKQRKPPVSQGTRGRHGGIVGAAPSSYEQELADADVGIAEAGGADVARQVAAQQSRRGVVRERLDKVTAALRKKTLRPVTRLRLTQERAQLLGELRGIDTAVKELEAGAAEDAANAQNEALIAAMEALTEAQEAAQAAAEAEAELERERIELERQHIAMLAELKASIDQQNAISSSTVAIGLREAQRALGDMISGQLGTRTLQRGTMPGSGQLASMGNSRY